MQKTKMIFTIGPASDNEEILSQFIDIGMSAARLNFSHVKMRNVIGMVEYIKEI